MRLHIQVFYPSRSTHLPVPRMLAGDSSLAVWQVATLLAIVRRGYFISRRVWRELVEPSVAGARANFHGFRAVVFLCNLLAMTM